MDELAGHHKLKSIIEPLSRFASPAAMTLRGFLLHKNYKMNLVIKIERDKEDIEIARLANQGLFVEITQSHGSSYFFLDAEEVESLKSYLEFTDERMD